MPSRDYLNQKRGSVFHRAFKSTESIKDFKAPIVEKSQADIDALCKLFSTSFLTKELDHSQHVILAKSMTKQHFHQG